MLKPVRTDSSHHFIEFLTQQTGSFVKTKNWDKEKGNQRSYFHCYSSYPYSSHRSAPRAIFNVIDVRAGKT